MDRIYFRTKQDGQICLDICPYDSWSKDTKIGSKACVEFCESFCSGSGKEQWIECKQHTMHLREEKLKNLING